MTANQSSRETKVDEQCLVIRSETRALKREVSASLARRKRQRGRRLSALLMLEPNGTGLPAALIQDTVLAPVDKVIWMVLMIGALSGDGISVLPTKAALAKSANVAAKGTVLRALSVLRCRRWLTACHTSLHRRGRHKNSAYILHAIALPLQDTIYLDPHYPAFLEKSTSHSHAAVRKVARAALEEIQQQSYEQAKF